MLTQKMQFVIIINKAGKKNLQNIMTQHFIVLIMPIVYKNVYKMKFVAYQNFPFFLLSSVFHCLRK